MKNADGKSNALPPSPLCTYIISRPFVLHALSSTLASPAPGVVKTGTSTSKKSNSEATSPSIPALPPPPRPSCQHKHRCYPINTNAIRTTYNTITQAYLIHDRKFSGDESFLKDPNAFNDAKNTAVLQVVDKSVEAEDKSRL